MHRKYGLLLLLILIINISIIAISFAENIFSPEKLFLEANKDYKSGNVNNSIDAYEEIIHNGYSNAALYYNLGTAYLDMGQIGKAILNFERALILSPRDRDIVFNLTYAKSLMKQKDPFPDSPRFMTYIKTVVKKLNLKENIVLADVLLYMLILIFIISLFSHVLRPYLLGCVILTLFFLILQTFPIIEKFEYERDGAIAVKSITDVRIEPTSDSRIMFPLYEGMQVLILRKSGEWFRIERPDGSVGWVPEDTVERIFPQN